MVEGEIHHMIYYQNGMLVYNRDGQLKEVCKTRILVLRLVKNNDNINIIIMKVMLGVVALVHA